MAIFGAFTEGLQLFATLQYFNFPRFNKMKGMGQIVTWSTDESLHTESIIKLFTFLSENSDIDAKKLQVDLYKGL